jgi:HAD superfamily phosphatase (TIGR01668 family)
LLERFVPDEAVERLSRVDLDALRSQGLTTLLLDLDNTITPWRSLEVPEDIAAWLAEAKQHFRVCIVSNTSKMKRFTILKEKLGIEGVGFASKPWGLKRVLRDMGLTPGEVVVLGDQLITDVAGGKMIGARSILVKPVSRDEFFGTKFVRAAESILFWLLKRRGLFVCPWQ